MRCSHEKPGSFNLICECEDCSEKYCGQCGLKCVHCLSCPTCDVTVADRQWPSTISIDRCGNCLRELIKGDRFWYCVAHDGLYLMANDSETPIALGHGTCPIEFGHEEIRKRLEQVYPALCASKPWHAAAFSKEWRFRT